MIRFCFFYKLLWWLWCISHVAYSPMSLLWLTNNVGAGCGWCKPTNVWEWVYCVTGRLCSLFLLCADDCLFRMLGLYDVVEREMFVCRSEKGGLIYFSLSPSCWTVLKQSIYSYPAVMKQLRIQIVFRCVRNLTLLVFQPNCPSFTSL